MAAAQAAFGANLGDSAPQTPGAGGSGGQQEEAGNGVPPPKSASTNDLNNLYLARVGQMVAQALDPMGINVQVDIETPEGQTTSVSSGKATTATANDGPRPETGAKPKEPRTQEEEEAKEDKTAGSGDSMSSVETIPENEEEEFEWTVLSRAESPAAEKSATKPGQ